MACGCQKNRGATVVQQSGTIAVGGVPAPAPRMGDPVVAAATGRWEVRTADGSASGRVYTDRSTAEAFARRIAGTVVAV